MEFPKLELQKVYRRGKFYFFVLSLEHNKRIPFHVAGKHRLRTNKVVTPSGDILLGPDLLIIEEFGNITEHSYLEVIYKVDMNSAIFSKNGNYELHVGQVVEGRRWGDLVKLVVVKS